MPDPLAAVASFLDAHIRQFPGPHLLVAVSGGPDSSVLLHALARLGEDVGYALSIGHFNHGVRPMEADRDAAFVAECAAEYGLTLHTGRADGDMPSDEASMRDARYVWLLETAERIGATHIATGHTRDDQVETVLFRMARGTGLDGLSGMADARQLHRDSNVKLLRPLLQCSRAEIEAHAREHGIRFVQDASNADRTRTRNRIRHDIVPQFRAVQAEFDAHVSGMAARIAGDAAYLNELARDADRAARSGAGCGWVSYRRSRLLHTPFPLASRIVRAAFREVRAKPTTPDAASVDAVLAALARDTTGAADLSGGVRVRWSADVVALCHIPGVAELAPVPLGVPGEALWRPTGQRVAVHEPGVTTLGLRTGTRLQLRGWRDGDRWSPYGHGGRESVSETLRQLGVPRDRRPAWPVVVDDDRVLWVVGARPPAGCDPEAFHTLMEVSRA